MITQYFFISSVEVNEMWNFSLILVLIFSALSSLRNARKFHSFVFTSWIFIHEQQLLQHESSSYGDQVTLDTPTTSHSHMERLQDVPTLPLPLVNSRLTRVTFATKATPPPLKGKPLLSVGSGNAITLSKPRASSFNVSTTDNNMAKLKNLHANSQSSEDLNTAEANFVGIGERLKKIETQIHTSSINLIIGAQDYDPSRSGANANEWEELEMRAATGCQGVQRENFTPSTLVMDCTTDNSKMPHCVVNGKLNSYSIFLNTV